MRRALPLLAMMALVACEAPPATEVIVRFAAAPELRSRAARLHLQVWTSEGAVAVDRTDPVSDAGADLARVPVIPLGGDAARFFSVRGELFDAAGVSLGVERASSGYLRDQISEILLVFESACASLSDCGDGRRCVSGNCVGACVTPTAGHPEVETPARCGACQRCAGNRCESLENGSACGCAGDRCQGGLCAVARPLLSMSVGGSHTCAVPVAGDLYCWGSNTDGQLGLAGVEDVVEPRLVLNLSVFYRGVYAADVATCVLGGDEARICFGQNWLGQLGTGAVDVGGAAQLRLTTPPLRELAAGSSHFCGLDAADGLWCWGYNEHAQLGRGTTSHAEGAPARIDMPGVRMVEAGGLHTCALTNQGALTCWGYNDSGQLGVGDFTDRLSPVVPGCDGGSPGACFVDWSFLSAGAYHTCGIRADRSLWCWGGNSNSQLGVGAAANDERIPLRVSGGFSWSVVSAGFQHTCAIRDDGSLWCWGAGADGQLGNGSRDRHSQPSPISASDALLKWDEVKTGKSGAHTCALRSDRTLWCWGRNDHGQLGIGTAAEASVTTPRRVCFPAP